ncbi:hypothetical protein [Mariniflexile sp.]|uniref:hypothetical protein n=1 Tax=Mariniflexile sp. TaxID=1979402 RepID=UPI00404753F6
MLSGQAFYKKYMMEYGFGEKTFGLLVDKEKQRVKVTFINAKYGLASYPSDGGGASMKAEIKEYFVKNPNEKSGDHFLVTYPVDDPKTADAPYYGGGRWCYALDYNDMDVKNLGVSRDATVYIGVCFMNLGMV